MKASSLEKKIQGTYYWKFVLAAWSPSVPHICSDPSIWWQGEKNTVNDLILCVIVQHKFVSIQL